MRELRFLEFFHITTIILLVLVSVLGGRNLGGIKKRTFFEADKFLLVLRLGAALGIAVDIFTISLLTYQVLFVGLITAWFKLDLILYGVIFLLTIFMIKYPGSLFPQDSGILLSAGRNQKKKLTACLWRLLFSFFIYGLWVCYLLFTIESYSFQEQVVHLLFSLITLIGLFYYGRLSVNTVYERLETVADQQYQSELFNFIQVIRSQRHDFNFHMQAVAGMIENQKYEECTQYVRSMVSNVERLNDVLPLKNPAISALLHTFLEISLSRGIHLEIQILDQLEDISCTIYEINSVIGNLLQNAIDETEGKDKKDRWIRLLIMKRSRRHIIKVSNPCDKKQEEYKNIFLPGYSTKQSHEGIGLATVKKISLRYGGAVYLEHEPGVVHVIFKIPVSRGF